jgi:hypothetical protein
MEIGLGTLDKSSFEINNYPEYNACKLFAEPVDDAIETNFEEISKKILELKYVFFLFIIKLY